MTRSTQANQIERPFGAITTRVRKPAAPSASELVQEIGIRSFGKGLFHKPPVVASELGTKSLFSVVPGCLVFNIVFAWEGAVALTSASEEGLIASHRFPMYLPAEGVAPRYLLWFFRSPLGVHRLGLASPGGAGRNRTLGQDSLHRLRVPLPSLAVQQATADLLDNLAARIATAESLVVANERLRLAVAHRLVTGQLETDPAPRRPSSTGHVPAAWEALDLRSACACLSGGTPRTADEASWLGDVPWVCPVDMKSFELERTSTTVSRAAAAQLRTAPAGAVLVVTRGMILNRKVPVSRLSVPAVFNQDIKALVPNGRISSDFLGRYLEARGHALRGLVTRSSHGTCCISTDRLLATPCFAPSVTRQQEIVAQIEVLAKRTAAEEEELDALRRLLHATVARVFPADTSWSRASNRAGGADARY